MIAQLNYYQHPLDCRFGLPPEVGRTEPTYSSSYLNYALFLLKGKNHGYALCMKYPPTCLISPKPVDDVFVTRL
jgi:hypothetical protein